MDEKKCRNSKTTSWFNSYASSFNVEILDSELRLKDAEFAIKGKFIDLLTKLTGFKLVETLQIRFLEAYEYCKVPKYDFRFSKILIF